MNFSRFRVLRIQETDYRPHFTCGGILYFLKHYKHTARCVSTVQMSANCVRALTKNPKTWHACAPSWPQRCSGNIRKRELTFWITLVYGFSSHWTALRCRTLSGVTKSQTAAISCDSVLTAAARCLCGWTLITLLPVLKLGSDFWSCINTVLCPQLGWR